MSKTVKFQLRIPYYGYERIGDATCRVNFDDKQEAKNARDEINHAFKTFNESKQNELSDKYLDGDGHITDAASLYEVTTEEKLID